MKMERNSISVLGSQQPNKILLVIFFSCMLSKIQTKPINSLLQTKYSLVMVIADIFAAKYDENGLKENCAIKKERNIYY